MITLYKCQSFFSAQSAEAKEYIDYIYAEE